MNITLYHGENKRSLNTTKINFIVGNDLDMLVQLCNTLASGFEGKHDNNFLVDGSNVRKSDFNVLFFNAEYNYSYERQLKTKSLIYSNFLLYEVEQIDDNFYKEFDETNKNIAAEISNISKKLSGITNIDASKLLFRSPDILDYIVSNSSIDGIDNDYKMFKFILKLLSMTKMHTKKTIAILEFPENYLNDIDFLELLEGMNNNNNVTYFIISKNYSYFKYINNTNIYNQDLFKISLVSYIQKTIIDIEYSKITGNSNVSYEAFYEQGISLITKDDISYYAKYIAPYMDIIAMKLYYKESTTPFNTSEITDEFLKSLLKNIA